MTHERLQAALLVAVTTLMPGRALASDLFPGFAAPAAAMDLGDCQDAADLDAKEACFARLPAAMIEECESLRLFACAPYRNMHIARQAHEAAIEALAHASRRTRTTGLDPSYADTLVDRLRDAERAWEAWRDAECALEPLLDGMSRNEAGDLAEACRAEKTRARVDLVRARATGMEDAER